MKVKMKAVTIYGLKENRKAVMEFLQKKGCVEFKEATEALPKVNTGDAVMSFERYIANSEKALSILDKARPEKKPLLYARKTLPENMFSMTVNESGEVGSLVNSIITADKKIAELRLEKSRLSSKAELLSSWSGLDIPLSFSGTKNTVSEIGTLPYEVDDEKIAELFLDCDTPIYKEVISSSKTLTCLFFIYLRSDADKAQKAIRERGISPPAFSLSHLSATEKIAQINGRIKKCEEEEASLQNEIENAALRKDKIRLFYDHIKMRRDKYLALSDVGMTEKTFVADGYAPEKAADSIKAVLEEKYTAYVEVKEIPEDEEAPVLLHNNGFSSPLEGITETYAMPSKFDIDPDFIMSLFYYLFFGMMFSDAGYGLLLMIVTGYIAFFSKAEISTKKNMRMFFFCGVSTTFWGLMYGSFFGDAVTQIGKTFFSHPEWKFPALWMDPVSQPLKLLIFSIALGAVQIITGLSISVHTNWRKGDKVAAICDSGSWIFVIAGIGLYAASTAFENSGFLYYPGLAMILLGFLTILLMKGRASKNPFARIGSGILGLYNITGYVSDVLSYSRLMALGLSTGVIAQVVNTMATLAGKNFIGVIMFLAIFLIGHAINFSINMLGAYVHTNRLQYVEFFGKFYEGGGRKFSPLKMNTNYYIFKEDK